MTQIGQVAAGAPLPALLEGVRPGCRIARSAAQPIPNGTITYVALDTEVVDQGGMWTPTRTLTGQVTFAQGTTALVGQVGTRFLAELAPGQAILAGSAKNVVVSVADDQHATVARAWPSSAPSPVALVADGTQVVVREAGVYLLSLYATWAPFVATSKQAIITYNAESTTSFGATMASDATAGENSASSPSGTRGQAATATFVLAQYDAVTACVLQSSTATQNLQQTILMLERLGRFA